MAGFFTVLAFLLTAYFLGSIVYRRFFSAVSHVPGPFFAQISVLWQLWHVWRGDYHNAIRAAHRRYGPLVRVTHEEVSACNGEAVRKILSTPLDKAGWYRVFAMPDASFPNQMSELSVAKHIALQKKIARGYAMASNVHTEDRFTEPIQLFQQGVERAAMQDPKGGVDVCEWFAYYAYDIVGLTTFSQAFGFLRTGTDVGGSIGKAGPLKTYLAIMAHFPNVHDTLMSIFTPMLLRLNMQPTTYVLQTTEKAIHAREKDEEAGNDMFAYWKQQKPGDPISGRDLFATANANVAAGGETVASVGATLVYYVLKHPTCTARLRKEIDEAMQQGRLSSPAQYRETQQLPFFQACLKETLRIHPIPHAGFARVAPKGGLELDGKFFAEGCVVSVNPWAIHFDPGLFGDDAHLFNPDRWLDTDQSRNLESNFIPLGKGYMTCPGRNLALFEMSKLLVTMFVDWEMELHDPTQSLQTHGTIVVQSYGWRVKVSKRKQTSTSTLSETERAAAPERELKINSGS